MTDCMDGIYLFSAIILWIGLTVVIIFLGWLTLAWQFPYSYGHPSLGASGENIEGFWRALQFWGAPAVASSAGIIINFSVGQELIVRIGVWEESEERRNRLNWIGKGSVLFSGVTLLFWTSLLFSFHFLLMTLPFMITLTLQCLVISLTLVSVFFVIKYLVN